MFLHIYFSVLQHLICMWLSFSCDDFEYRSDLEDLPSFSLNQAGYLMSGQMLSSSSLVGQIDRLTICPEIVRGFFLGSSYGPSIDMAGQYHSIPIVRWLFELIRQRQSSWYYFYAHACHVYAWRRETAVKARTLVNLNVCERTGEYVLPMLRVSYSRSLEEPES